MPTPETLFPRRPDWRDPASYAYTRHLSSEGWAWEFLRRNPRYRAAWRQHVSKDDAAANTENIRLISRRALHPDAQAWGLLAFECPDLTALEARVFWRPKVCPFRLAGSRYSIVRLLFCAVHRPLHRALRRVRARRDGG